MAKDKIIAIRVSEETKRSWEKLAKEKNVSVTVLIEDAFGELEQLKKENQILRFSYETILDSLGTFWLLAEMNKQKTLVTRAQEGVIKSIEKAAKIIHQEIIPSLASVVALNEKVVKEYSPETKQLAPKNK